MGSKDKKNTPAQRLGEKTAASFLEADASGIVTDPQGSYSGLARFDPPPEIRGSEAGPMRLGPMQFGAESVQFQNPAMEVRPIQDADDL